jgi:hypothetical protein
MGVRDVGDMGESPGAREIAGDPLGRCLVAVDQNDHRILGGEAASGGLTDARARACDDDGLAFKSLRHIQSFFVRRNLAPVRDHSIVAVQILIFSEPNRAAIAVHKVAVFAVALVGIFHDGSLHLAFAVLARLGGLRFLFAGICDMRWRPLMALRCRGRLFCDQRPF